MGNALTSYGRSDYKDENYTETLKASIRPQTGVFANDGDFEDDSSTPPPPSSTNSLNQNFIRNRKELVSMRSSKYSTKALTPLPPSEELEKRFAKVLASMDLPPDKAKLLKQYDDQRKWEILCDQELVQAKDPPRIYLRKLQTYLDPKASKSFKKRKGVVDGTSTQVLKDLEISLRTNNIEWVREFLSFDNRGLEVLVEYLNYRLTMMRDEEKTEGEEVMVVNGTNSGGSPGTMKKRLSRLYSKMNLGDSKDDIHICILCLRAIMNNKHGLSNVIQNQEAINGIALSLTHQSLRTKALVLELLAAICLVQGGHSIILKAFHHFKKVMKEERRFQTLVHDFMHYDFFHVEFMASCMQFINIVVHSCDDMNERVYLQYEFSSLGIDDYLDKMKNTPSEELRVQISAYLDNVFDVSGLMEDSETKSAAIERVGELEEELSLVKELYEKLENESLGKVLNLELRINELGEERDSLLSKQREIFEEVSTLRKTVSEKEEESRNLLQKYTNLPKTPFQNHALTPTPKPNEETKINPAPPPPPPPPPLPQPSLLNNPKSNSSIPPPPPPLAPNSKLNMTIKKSLTPKCKLPTLNWTVLKPREVKGTVFNQLDDTKYYGNGINFESFETMFRIGPLVGARGGDENDGGEGFPSHGSTKRFKKPEALTLLEHTRLRNMAISRRKLDLEIETVIKGVNSLDLNLIKNEQVEILQRMLPNEVESKLYREYTLSKKDINELTEEDKFLLQLSRIERIGSKLSVMSYIISFSENLSGVVPQIQSIIIASRSLRLSTKFHQVLEIILAFGNYMNGAKRGPAYGFKIMSLDCLSETKSYDKKQSLMHFLVETISSKYPDLSGFLTEISYIEKASQASLENIQSDVQDLERGMELTKKEDNYLRQKNEINNVIREFLGHGEEKLLKVKGDLKKAISEFGDCVEFYGEERSQIGTCSFFTSILKFIKAYKLAEAENNARKAVKSSTVANAKPNLNSGKKQQEELINELKKKQGLENNKKLQETYHGALEDILSDLKNEPYRRADALRRSQRRKIDQRLSKNFDELDI